MCLLPLMLGDMKEGSAIHTALSKGYIVASFGERGRNRNVSTYQLSCKNNPPQRQTMQDLYN